MTNKHTLCPHGEYSAYNCEACSPGIGDLNKLLVSYREENDWLRKQNKVLLEFAKKHHEVCEDCEGTGKVYNNADPTSGQWVYCPYAEAIRRAEGKS